MNSLKSIPLLFALFFFIPVFGAEISLIPDPFPGEWNVSGMVDVHATRMGSKFIRLSAQPEETARLSSVPMTIEGKKAVEVSLRYRSTVANSGNDFGAWVLLTLADKEGKSLPSLNLVCPKAPVWREAKRYMVLPPGATQLTAQVRLQQSGGEFEISHLTIRDCELIDNKEVADGVDSFEVIERFELASEGKRSFLRSKTRVLEGTQATAYPSMAVIRGYVLPAKLTESPDLCYELETTFTMGANDAKPEAASLVTMGRNMTGAAEPDSFSIMLWNGAYFLARLTSDNPSIKADLGKRGLSWRQGERHTVRVRFGAHSLEGWLDGVSWGTAQIPNSFSWKKDRPFFIGGETAEGNPWLGKIEAFSLTVLRPSFQVVFDGDKNAGYFTGPGPHVWGFAFSKGQGGGAAASIRVKNQRGDDLGEVIFGRSSSSDRRDFMLPPLPYGSYNLQTRCEKGGKSSVVIRSFVITPPLERIAAAESSFGLTTEFPLNGNRFSEVLVRDTFQRIAASGVRWFRLWQRWDDIEDAPGHYQWANLDRVVALAQASGLELYPALTGGALDFQTTQSLKEETWGMMTTACYAPADLGRWKLYLKALAERYKGKIKVYQIWNEPDAKNGFYPFDPKAYVEVLKASAETLRAVDPTIKVGLGGFAAALIGGGGSATHSPAASAWSGRAFYAENPGSFFDIVDLHYYSVSEPEQSWDRNTEAARGTRRFLDSIGEGGKPVWNSETSMYSGKEGTIGGWANVKCLSEQAQAMELIRFHVQSLAVGIQRSFWYGLFGEVGLIQQDFSPKPAYAAQINVARLLQGARFIEELRCGPNVRAYRFLVSGRELVALWTTGDTVNMGITHGGQKSWSQVDAFGNEQPHEEATTLLKLTGDPLFLSSVGPLVVKPLANIALVPWSGSGPVNTVRMSIFNPSEAKVKVEYAVTAGGSESPLLEANLAPGEERALNIELPSMVNPVLAEVRFSGGIDQLLEIEQNLTFRKYIKLGAEPVSLNIDAIDQVKLGAETRDLQARLVSAATWKGAKDLSAKVALHRVGEKVFFQAVITDDQVIPAADGSLWNGDCLELFLVKNEGMEGVDSYQAMIAADGRISWRTDHVWKGFTAKVTKTPQGYVVDGSFSMDGKSIGFNIAVDDADDLNRRKSQLFWSLDRDGVLIIER